MQFTIYECLRFLSASLQFLEEGSLAVLGNLSLLTTAYFEGLFLTCIACSTVVIVAVVCHYLGVLGEKYPGVKLPHHDQMNYVDEVHARLLLQPLTKAKINSNTR